MDYKLLGAALITLGCGGFGFSLAAAHKKEEWNLRQLIMALDFMGCELQYHMTPLPDLCRAAGRECAGVVGKILIHLARELDTQLSPDVSVCMRAALAAQHQLPKLTRDNLTVLGNSLGRFDLNGQIMGLESVRANCRRDLEQLSNNREGRLRSYQTLGLCAGAAIAIILI